MRVLDLGCGPGCSLASWGVTDADQVTGVDIDAGGLAIAREKFPNRTYLQGMGECLPFEDESFDRVISSVALPYMNIPRALAEIHRCLIPGGGLSLSLHLPSFTMGELVHHAVPKPIPTLFRLYVMANGVLFHFTSETVGFFNRRTESFQTEHGMRVALGRAGFVNYCFHRQPGPLGETFTVDAKKAKTASSVTIHSFRVSSEGSFRIHSSGEIRGSTHRLMPRPSMKFEILREFPTQEREKAWRDCLDRVEFPSHYNAPEFFREPFWGGKPRFAILALEDSRVVGVLTGLHAGKDVMCGLPSRPQICVDPTADVETTIDSLAQGLLTEAGDAELVNVYTWPSLHLESLSRLGFRCRELSGDVVLDLTLGAEALFRQFPKDRRRNIRFAEKNGVEVSEAMTPQDVVDAYSVYAAWRRTARKTVVGEVLSFEVFEKAVSLKGNRRLFVARVSGKPIAINIFRFYPGGLFESSGNSSLDEFIHLKPNDLLQWKGIQWACRNGLRLHSLGGSHQFLRRFGGTVVPIFRYRLDRTALHRHELREKMEEAGRRIVHKLPPPLEKGIRVLAGRERS